MSLGQLLQPQPQADPELKSQWQSWLDNPANKAALMGFGIQALSGSYGSAGQQLAAAMGNGMASGAGYEKIAKDDAQQAWERQMKEQALAQAAGDKDEARTVRREELALRAQEGEANRTSHEKIAGIYANSREAIAGSKADLKPLIQQEWMKAYNMAQADIMLSTKPAEERDVEARRRANAAAEAFRAQFGGAETSEKPAKEKVPKGGAVTPVSPISPSATVPANPATPTTTGGKPSLAELLANPKYKDITEKALTHPAARDLLKSKVRDPQSLDAYRVAPVTPVAGPTDVPLGD